MPNHVTNRVVVKGPSAQISQFMETCFRTEPEGRLAGVPSFDFNTLIPMPDVVRNTTSGSEQEMGIEILTGTPKPPRLPGFPTMSVMDSPWIKSAGITNRDELREWAEKNRPNALKEGAQSVECHRQTGFWDWYDWALANWGTKWNAYETRIVREDAELVEFLFDTAWSPPEPIYQELARRFPALTVRIKAFDEGWGFGYEALADNGMLHVDSDETATDERYEAVYGHPPDRDDD